MRLIQGKSLLARAIETSQRSTFIDKIVVSSEDQEIIAAAKLAGADVPFIRPQELATDETPGIAPILHALKELPSYDYVIVLQVTSPLRTTNDIDNGLNFCLRKKAPACVSVSEADKNPYWMFRINQQNELQHLLAEQIPARRQDSAPIYVLNGALYIANTNWLMHNKSFISTETVAYVMPTERSLDIDTEFDFKLLETYLS